MSRIAIIDHVGVKAGMDYYSSSLAKGFVESGCECSVFSNFEGIKAESITYYPFYEGHGVGKLIKLMRVLKATFQSVSQARKEKADLVIIHVFAANILTLFRVLLPKLFGLKLAVIVHDVSSFVGADKSMIQNLVYNKLADYIVVHNQYSYEEFFKSIHIQEKNKVVVIKHGGYLDHIRKPLSKELARKELNLDVHGKYILFFGQIKHVKGLDVLLEAMAQLPKDIQLIIAGKPWKADFSDYDEQIEKYGLSDRVIKMIRFIEDEERELLFFAADVNVLPYRVIYQSGVLLMAMSHGLPVIASDLPANKEIITHGKSGLLFCSEDAEDLAEKVECFFQGVETQEKLATSALETIKNDYAWRGIAEDYLKMLVNK